MKRYTQYYNVLSLPKPDRIRRGQHAFNVLYAMYPKLADTFRGGELDPFYQDKRLPDFLKAVEAALSDTERGAKNE